MQISDFSNEINIATQLARAAAAAILEVRARPDVGAHEKAQDQGPVTDADLAADRVLYEGLRAAFPSDTIVTEERWTPGETMPAGGRVWFVDPLDGTADFVCKTPDYAVMLGLVIDGAPVLGVVAQPETGLIWRGICAGDGAGRCERLGPRGETLACSFTDLPARQGNPRAAVSRSHPSRMVQHVAQRLGVDLVPKGSVGLKVGLIVDGDAELYISSSRRIKVWDTAAPQAIMNAAGGLFTALDGSPLSYRGDAAHPAGVRAWSKTTEADVEPKLMVAVQEWGLNPQGESDRRQG